MDVDGAMAVMEDYGADTQTAERVAAYVITHFGPDSPEARRVCAYMEGTEAAKCGLVYLAMRGETPEWCAEEARIFDKTNWFAEHGH